MRTEVRAFAPGDFAPGDFDTERARAIQDAFRTGHIITGHVRADGARDRDDHAE
jgi:riboflavin synthase alpha subunit